MKRPLGDDGGSGALMLAKRSRQDLVPVLSGDQQTRTALIPAVSSVDITTCQTCF